MILQIPEALVKKSLEFANLVTPTTANYIRLGKQKDPYKIARDHFISKLAEVAVEQWLDSQNFQFNPDGRTDWNIYKSGKRGKSFKEDLCGKFPGKDYLSKINVKACKSNGKYADSWTFQHSATRCDSLFEKPKLETIADAPKLSQKIIEEPILANLFIGVRCLTDLETESNQPIECEVAAVLPIKLLSDLELFEMPILKYLADQKRVIYYKSVKEKLRALASGLE